MAHLYSTNCACVACEDGRAVEWKKPKFTPGPWHTDATTQPNTWAVWSESGTSIAHVGEGKPSQGWTVEKNARLIAAAPDLAQLLMETVGRIGPASEPDFQQWANRVEAALRKAGVL